MKKKNDLSLLIFPFFSLFISITFFKLTTPTPHRQKTNE